MTTNGLLSAIWDYTINRETDEPQVYNYASSDWKPYNLCSDFPNVLRVIRENSSSKMVWYPFMLPIRNIYVFLLFHVLLYVFPAIIADVVIIIQRKKPRALNIVYKLSKQIKLLHYFMNTSWVIKTDKLKSVANRLNATDEKEFPFDLKLLDWDDEAAAALYEFRKILKDPMDTLPYARKKYRNLKILHYSVLTIFPMLAFFFLFRVIINLCY